MKVCKGAFACTTMWSDGSLCRVGLLLGPRGLRCVYVDKIERTQRI